MPHFYASGVSDELIDICNNHTETIANTLQQHPNASVQSSWKRIYPKPFVLKRLYRRFAIKHDLYSGRGDPTKADLDRAERCGKFPYRPSDLFLKIFSDVLLCLERDPLSNMCAPPLIGTSAVMPLSIISVIPDIMQHYYDCIVRAEKEVVLLTNYWQPSNSVNKVSAGLMDLSKRAGERGARIVVKIMWDRGQWSQLVDNHARVTEEGREALDLPRPDEIPNIDLEVINFHRPLLGTFHVKFLVVDRKVALLNSNNIQDRPNLEMMIHLEGAVVESFYDVFLYSWHHNLVPALPCVVNPPANRKDHTAKAYDFKFQEQNEYLSDIELVRAARAARAMLHLEKDDDEKLSRLRGEADKERMFGGYGQRFQAVLGAISESRRGSFSADVREQQLHRGEGAEHGQHAPDGSAHGQEAKQNMRIPFADAVFKAMDARRKGNLSPGGGRHEDPHSGASAAVSASSTAPASRVVSREHPVAESSNAGVGTSSSAAAAAPDHGPLPSATNTSEEQPGLVNWEQPSTTLQQLNNEINRISSPARAREVQAHADEIAGPRRAKTSTTSAKTEESAHVLPALNLPGASLTTPTDSKAASVHTTSQTNLAAPETETLQSPGSQEHEQTRALSPVYSERSSAAHPSASAENLALNASAAETSAKETHDAAGLPHGQVHAIDYASSETGGTPVLTTSQYSEATHSSGKMPETPPNVPVASTSTAAGSVNAKAGQGDTPRSYRSWTSPNSALFSHTMDKDGKPLPWRFSTIAERRNANHSLGSSSAGSKPAPKKNWIEGLVLGKGSKAPPPVPPPSVQTPRQRALSNALNAGALSQAWSTVEDGDLLDEFNPHTLHHAHDPFPIAMVNRKPHGLPGHQDIRVPQDAAWLAGIRYAQKSVFIQTPTFNAKPIVRACVDACRRGIQVTIWVDLGFNDKGESMPFQGGTNEQVVERMYKDLRKTGHNKNLHVFWYTGKDMMRPLNAVKKQRNCHVKFMQIDDQVGIQGNGNQDTQSWYHSGEVNVMVDSSQIVHDWMEALHRQQNTDLYGKVDQHDGIWRDKATGKTPAEMDTWEAELREKEKEQEKQAQEQGQTQAQPAAAAA